MVKNKSERVKEQSLQNINNSLANLNKELKEASNRETENKNIKKESCKDGVYLFFSFDVVNSTMYKAINYFNWSQTLHDLFRELISKVKSKMDSSEIWRVLGDEAIFIIKITDENNLNVYVDNIFEILVFMINYLEHEKIGIMANGDSISLKAAAWIAKVKDIGFINEDFSSDSNGYDNIFEIIEQDENQMYEFLGNDIDAGFRVSTNTREGRLTLSYELAYLISKKTESLSNLTIMTYRKLKGIWNNKLYPVIWYHNPKAYVEYYQKKIALEDSFRFDECEENDIIKEFYLYRGADVENDAIKDKKMYTDTMYALEKILDDRKLSGKIDSIIKEIKNSSKARLKILNADLMEVHCVAVCFKIIDEKIYILIAKRTDERERLQGKWEFGCAKAVTSESISEKIVKDYKKLFDVDIEPIMDTGRKFKNPIPLALYEIKHNESEQSDKGIITLARIVSDFSPDSFKPDIKHQELRWITEDYKEFIDKNKADLVDDFEDTIKKAIKMIRKL